MTARLHIVSEADRDAERALAARVSSGDESAFEELYRAHSSRVYALCLRMCGSRQRATELTQDVFVHLWQRLASWRGESALSSWIHRVTVNLVLSNVRSETRRQKHEVDESDLPSAGRREPRAESREPRAESREPRAESPEPRAESPEPRAASVLDAIDLERAIAALPRGARTVFVLHDVEGYRHDEIARMTGTAEGTCRAQLHRARKLLMEALQR